MSLTINIKRSIFILGCLLFSSCEDFLDLEAPKNKITSEVVFENDQTAISAMTGIYNQLYIATFSAGWQNSVTVLAGLSADNLEAIWETNLSYREFEQNEILPTNDRNLDVWSSAYNIIYLVNSLLEGIESSQEISQSVREKLEGEAKFVRAFTYFYLINLYGTIPLILSTKYQSNALASRESEEIVHQQIIEDLETSIQLLNNSYTNGERTFANKNTSTALLARVYLYQQEWKQAETLSSDIIAQTGNYQLLEDLNQVFLANSEEAIWQLSPISRGNLATHTNEGSVFIINPFFSSLSHLKLSNNLVNSFDEEDLRLGQWIAYHEGLEVFYPFKYKIRNSTAPVSEYSMVLRLAEQYLIRAEARARLGDISGSLADIDKIRERSGLNPLSESSPNIGRNQLLAEILKERRKELFAEWGHRWMDLKRTQQATDILHYKSPNWEETDVLYPIPAEERNKNPNLEQNPGY